MKRYAVYKNRRLVSCLCNYESALALAIDCQDFYCDVAVVDMEDGALCYYWNY